MTGTGLMDFARILKESQEIKKENRSLKRKARNLELALDLCRKQVKE